MLKEIEERELEELLRYYKRFKRNKRNGIYMAVVAIGLMAFFIPMEIFLWRHYWMALIQFLMIILWAKILVNWVNF